MALGDQYVMIAGTSTADMLSADTLGIGTALDTDQHVTTSKGAPEYFLNGISCDGNESSILECSWSSLRNHQCNSTRIAMVRCSTGSESLSFILVVKVSFILDIVVDIYRQVQDIWPFDIIHSLHDIFQLCTKSC